VSEDVPVAAIENVAVCPTVTSWLTGWVVIDGATAWALTVRVAALLVALPALLVSTTVNRAPLSELAVAGVTYEEEIAPLIATAFFCHW
jgi:hypothetical protein